MPTAVTYVLLLLASVTGTSSSSGHGVHMQKVEGFTSRDACIKAGSQAVQQLHQAGSGWGTVKVSSSCIEKK